MTVTSLGIVSIGAALPATANATASVDVLGSTAIPSATGAISALAGLTLPELTAKAEGYMALAIPSPLMDIATQLAAATTLLGTLEGQVSALPGGIALITTLTAALAAQILAIGAIKTFNPALGLQIEQCVAAMAGMSASIAAGISGTNINMDVITARLGEIETALAAVDAQATIAAGVEAEASEQLEIAASINANLSVGGLRLYRFDGDISTAGAELQAQVTADGLTGSFHFVVMLPTSAPAWAALQATVKTS